MFLMISLALVFQNFSTQLCSIFLGIVAGSFVGWTAAEELPLYQKQLRFIAQFLFFATFVIPLFFLEQMLPLLFIGITYATLTLLQNDREWYFFVAPLGVFLSSQNNHAFFVANVLVFLATGIMTILIITSFVKKKELLWKKEIFVSYLQNFGMFVLFSLVIHIAIIISRFIT